MHDTHVEIPDYQKAYLDDQGLVFAQVVREAIDDRMVEDGADPERWKESYGV